ncbi:hypothetical protein [Rhodococcus sp. LB1]|uniref:hypothetical protein n=1 Tax=Rhodococcus sp. LB1 TaxID=1807499 RepID=UPI0012E728B9|nr:hypothetical protein [Rhodococcus sp. LB1]
MTSIEWVHDDPDIPNEAVVYRRVEKDGDPNNFSLDRIHETTCLGPGAFTAATRDKGPEGGLSAHLEYLLRRHGIQTADLVDDWDTFGVARFHVRDLREGGGGIIEKEDPDDAIIGKAHALMRSASPGMKARGAWASARKLVLERAVYFESDPGYSDDGDVESASGESTEVSPTDS